MNIGFFITSNQSNTCSGHGTEHCTTCHHPKPDDIKCYLSVNHCTHSWRNHPILCKHFINIDFFLDAIATISRWSFRKRTHQISYIIAHQPCLNVFNKTNNQDNENMKKPRKKKIKKEKKNRCESSEKVACVKQANQVFELNTSFSHNISAFVEFFRSFIDCGNINFNLIVLAWNDSSFHQCFILVKLIAIDAIVHFACSLLPSLAPKRLSNQHIAIKLSVWRKNIFLEKRNARFNLTMILFDWAKFPEKNVLNTTENIK